VNRAERRRQERAAAKRKAAPMIVGDGVIATSLGQTYDGSAVKGAELRAKVPGEHRWVATASWVLSMEQVEGAFDVDRIKLMDQENLMYLGIGCWDCEQPLGVVEVGSHCPAGATDA
jgi:hypothetical protein